MEKSDHSQKLRFRQEKCNIVEMFENKAANIPKDSEILGPLQSDEEFEKLLDANNWAVTQTTESNIVFVDLDSNECPKSLQRFFNRRRDKYVKNGERINSKHGFLKITDATHEECVKFAKRFHNKVGIEVYAEKHWMIFAGTYYNPKNIDDPKRKTTWYNLDDLHIEPIMEFTKEEIGSVFMELLPKPRKQIPAGQEKRHNALISLTFEKCKEINSDKKKVLDEDSLYDQIIQSDKIEGIEEYTKEQPKYEELKKIIQWVLETECDNESFAKKFINTDAYYFAHILNESENNQFNCWLWVKDYWTDNTAWYIFKDLLPLKSKGFIPTPGLASSIAAEKSAEDDTLKIKLDDKNYNNDMMNVITNNHGQYFDFRDGKVHDVDPSKMFFKYAQINSKFTDMDNAELPNHFIKFVEERFPDSEDQEVFYDHLAGSFLHTSVLRSKPKMLFVCGLHNSYKSLIIEILKMILNSHTISNCTVEQIAGNWGKSLIMDKIINYSEEQKVAEPEDPANLKDAITTESGYVHVKFAKKLQYASRFPRHIIMCNKISPIGVDDDDDSIFIRNQYLRIEKVEPQEDWRKLLLEESEIQKITMFLLKRAYEIFNNSREIKVQSLEESKQKHKEMLMGDFDDFLKNNFQRKGVSEDIGTSFMFIKTLWASTMPDKISSKLLAQKFDDAGHEKKTRNWVYRTDERNVFTEIGEGGDGKTQQTVIMGLKPTKRYKSATANEDSPSEENSGIVCSVK